eukprot:CAMPEP_0184297222 /NCGR_PEP_ID=MMETSP1049-20130417/8148_1 /TAXON_ID=77928 /ORGANISM="Proteomonas sulcata, Strain CCMP704" /LENGTH=69 /DNA_ID=CAMNT_0026606845 /DNA_START=43 /DNA_END=252 /DNA_ORIENTATION=+
MFALARKLTSLGADYWAVVDPTGMECIQSSTPIADEAAIIADPGMVDPNAASTTCPVGTPGTPLPSVSS